MEKPEKTVMVPVALLADLKDYLGDWLGEKDWYANERPSYRRIHTEATECYAAVNKILMNAYGQGEIICSRCGLREDQPENAPEF